MHSKEQYLLKNSNTSSVCGYSNIKRMRWTNIGSLLVFKSQMDPLKSKGVGTPKKKK